MSEELKETKRKVLKKITKQRLKNIALYYLERFESSTENLRSVLQRRINDYVYQNKEYNPEEALEWVEEILGDFQRCGYLDDGRFAEMKIRDYLAAGKSETYIRAKMAVKGVDGAVVDMVLSEQAFDPYENAMRLAKKKKIGPYRPEAERKDFYQKDMAVLARAGFDYDVSRRVMDGEIQYSTL